MYCATNIYDCAEWCNLFCDRCINEGLLVWKDHKETQAKGKQHLHFVALHPYQCLKLFCLLNVLMLVEESAPVPVESVEAREQTGKKVVKRSPFVSSYDSKISSSRSKTQQQQPCKYFRAKQVCPFGPRCRYSHSASSHFSGEEVSDFRALTVEHPPTIDGVQNRRKSDTVCYHYLKSTCRYGSKCMYRHPLKNPESDKAPSKTSRHVRKEHVPSERNLGSFLISSVNVRPKTKKSLKPFSTDLREVCYIMYMTSKLCKCPIWI